METNENKKRNIAILIDAENVLPAQADLIFDHAKSLGAVARKEIFGASSALGAWVSPVLKYAIHPNLTIKASKGKNSSDIALVIGAMDLLVAGGIDTVIIASSDSDFSALSVRLRNAGMEVIGMGMEKSNELWRTACSTFVVLQNQKAQPAKQPARAAKPQSAPEKAPEPDNKPAAPKAASRAARAEAMTHEERVAVIAGQIERRLQGHDKVQVSNLFPSLNQLAEYRVDKRDAGKKPLNYLTSTFGELFHFEEAADGQNYVSLQGGEAPAGEAPAEPEAPVGEAPVGEATVEEATVEAAPEAEAPAEAKKPARRSHSRKARPAEPEAPVAEEAPVEAAPAEEAAVETVGDAPDPLALLTAEGIEEDVAKQIVVIFTESDSLRQAYNKLRSVFGNTAGRDYYNQVKDIAGRQ